LMRMRVMKQQVLSHKFTTKTIKALMQSAMRCAAGQQHLTNDQLLANALWDLT